MIIAVIDGMGGSIGRQIIIKLRVAFGDEIELLALGTNAVAASNMMKAGANLGASGENAFVHSIGQADFIIGPLAMMVPNSFLGELTTKMAEAVSGAKGEKIILPLNNLEAILIGVKDTPLPHLMDEAIIALKSKIS
ncbi:MAG: DUF3842 family protein [Actinomycetota bacterium]|nr:DUF3842 family protein [Actinomycetota bacterium]